MTLSWNSALLTIDSPEIVNFLNVWVPPFGRKTRAVERRKYIALDYDNGPDSWSGCFLVDRVTHRIYSIKGYAVRGYDRGTVEEMTTKATRAHYEREAKATTRAYYEREAAREVPDDCTTTIDGDPGL